MSKLNYYELLGVSTKATETEIKKAYRKQAASNHPDVGGDAKKFLEIKKAYEVLKNPTLRSDYDLVLLRQEDRKRGDFYSRHINETHTTRPSHREEQKNTKSSDKLILFILSLIALSTLWIFISPLVFNNEKTPEESVTASKQKESGIRVGSTKNDVLLMYGEPDKKGRNTWNYGNSIIYFNYEGYIEGWTDEGELSPKK